MNINTLLQDINKKLQADTEIKLNLNPIEISYLFSLVDTHLFLLDESTSEYKIFESIFSKIEEADIDRRRDTVPFAVSMR
jgi:hypothetical protein